MSLAKPLFRFSEIGPLEGTNLCGKSLQGSAEEGQLSEGAGVAIPGDHLSGDRLCFKTEAVHNERFKLRIRLGEGANGSGEFAVRDLVEDLFKAHDVAV